MIDFAMPNCLQTVSTLNIAITFQIERKPAKKGLYS